MLSATKTSGHLPFCSNAVISVPGAPASSGRTFNQLDVVKPGVEMAAPLCVAVALLSTVHPPAPRVVRPGGAAAALVGAGATSASAAPSTAPMTRFMVSSLRTT